MTLEQIEHVLAELKGFKLVSVSCGESWHGFLFPDALSVEQGMLRIEKQSYGPHDGSVEWIVPEKITEISGHRR